MSEAKIVVGLDIGTSKIACLIAKIDESINILGVCEVKATGIKKGQIVDIEDAVVAINSALEGAERMAGYSASNVFVSIGGAHIESQNSRGVVAVSTPQGEITKNDIYRVIDAAKAISLPSSRQIVHVLPQNFIVDGQEGIKDPIGMNGVRLEVDTHIITANSTAVSNLEKAISEVGVDVNDFVFSGYSSSLSILSDTEKELGVVLVDIGAGTTDISIFVDGSICYSSVLPIGARHITNDLAIGLRISLESAEEIKLFLSKTFDKKKQKILNPEEEETTREAMDKGDEIDLSVLGLNEEVRKVSKKTLIDGIIKPRLNELFTMIGLEIKKSGYGGKTPAGLVVTGGGSKTIGVSESAKRMLAMPVRIGIPQGLKGIIDEIEDPSFAASVGLIVYASKTDIQAPLPFGISLPSLSGFKFNRVFSKVIEFIKSFIP